MPSVSVLVCMGPTSGCLFLLFSCKVHSQKSPHLDDWSPSSRKVQRCFLLVKHEDYNFIYRKSLLLFQIVFQIFEHSCLVHSHAQMLVHPAKLHKPQFPESSSSSYTPLWMCSPDQGHSGMQSCSLWFDPLRH